jgi:hypothetical protein
MKLKIKHRLRIGTIQYFGIAPCVTFSLVDQPCFSGTFFGVLLLDFLPFKLSFLMPDFKDRGYRSPFLWRTMRRYEDRHGRAGCIRTHVIVGQNLTVSETSDRGLKIHNRSLYSRCAFTTVRRKYYLKNFDHTRFFDSFSPQQLFVKTPIRERPIGNPQRFAEPLIVLKRLLVF